LSGRGSPPAGEAGKTVIQIAIRAFDDLKKGVTAGSSWVSMIFTRLRRKATASSGKTPPLREHAVIVGWAAEEEAKSSRLEAQNALAAAVASLTHEAISALTPGQGN
jgi:hypothetical protein